VGSLSLVPHPFKGSFIFRVVQHYDENTARNPVISTRALAREKVKVCEEVVHHVLVEVMCAKMKAAGQELHFPLETFTGLRS